MDSNILCALLAKRIPPGQFQIRGDKIVFVDPDENNKPVSSPNESPYDTPENRVIVDDVMANHSTLAAAYLAEKQAIAAAEAANNAAKAQAIIDNLPAWQPVSDALDGIKADAQAATTIAALKVVIIGLIIFVKKLARVLYWLAKDSET